MKTKAAYSMAAGAIAIAAIAGSAMARPETPRMSCGQAANYVNSRKAVVLTTGRGAGGDLYDRYVSTQGLCPTSTYGRPAFVQTRDNPQCFIGYYCSNSRPMFER